MAIISFWNQNNVSTGKTLSMIAIATTLAIQHEYKILILDTDFNSYTIQDCFWIEKEKNLFKQEENKIDLGTGITQLSRAILSNKISPEIITNYTKIVFKDRLEVLTENKINEEEYRKNKEILKQISKIADKYYDMVFVDISRTLDEAIKMSLLKVSDIVIVPIHQSFREINDFLKLKKNNKSTTQYQLMPLISSYNDSSKFTLKKITKYLKEKQEILAIPYSANFLDESSSGKISDFFINNRNAKEKSKNGTFINCTKKAADNMIMKMQELQTKI